MKAIGTRRRKTALGRLKSAAAILTAAAALWTLSGCGVYRGEVTRMGAPASSEYVTLVQGAVDGFKQKTGVLPIKNSTETTPIYEKYPIDFKKLQDANLLSVIPTNAFENGGTARYVLVNAETKPEVKLLDLPTYQVVGDLQNAVNDYIRGHAGTIPQADEVAAGFYAIDYDKLKRKPLELRSPYSRQFVGVVIDRGGNVGIDYTQDIKNAIAKKGAALDLQIDLRTLLVEQSAFVPAWSFPYRLKDGQPVLSQT
ncbi:hypothetical protein [Paenibacillus cymbidii]|uniref:hypothetical protein n=1 Tax=Paenibacillus cymbidii TaxID=1639034 RepID=UPI001F315C7D|nr:hypothetical protein [Paenibacillus cymbidii]